jgi:exosome complex component RRP46
MKASEGNQLRAMSAEQGPLQRADGSAIFTQGGSSVLVAVYGPGQAVASKLERPDRAVVGVEWRDEAGAPGPRDAARERLLRSTLEAAILLSAHPRCFISVVVQVLSDDGSITSAAVNASALALMDAGVEMTGVPVGITCAVSDGCIQLDPSAEEAHSADAIIFLCTLNDGEAGLLTSSVQGMVSTRDSMVQQTPFYCYY